MELKPVAHYQKPAYPTQELLLIHPEFLQATPLRWQQSAVLLSVLAATVTLVTPSTGNCQPAPTTPILNLRDEPQLPGDVMYVPVVPQDITPLTQAPPPAIRDGDTLTAPAAVIARHLDAQVSYDARADAVTIIKGKTTLVLTNGQRVASLNGAPVKLPLPALSRHNTCYAPARFLAETLGGQVQWNGNLNNVTIRSANGSLLSFKVMEKPPRPPKPIVQGAVTTPDQRRAALRDYIVWLKGEALI